MRTATKIIYDSIGINLYNYGLNENIVIDKTEITNIIEEAQKEAYNQAINDACKLKKQYAFDDN